MIISHLKLKLFFIVIPFLAANTMVTFGMRSGMRLMHDNKKMTLDQFNAVLADPVQRIDYMQAIPYILHSLYPNLTDQQRLQVIQPVVNATEEEFGWVDDYLTSEILEISIGGGVGADSILFLYRNYLNEIFLQNTFDSLRELFELYNIRPRNRSGLDEMLTHILSYNIPLQPRDWTSIFQYQHYEDYKAGDIIEIPQDIFKMDNEESKILLKIVKYPNFDVSAIDNHGKTIIDYFMQYLTEKDLLKADQQTDPKSLKEKSVLHQMQEDANWAHDPNMIQALKLKETAHLTYQTQGFWIYLGPNNNQVTDYIIQLLDVAFMRAFDQPDLSFVPNFYNNHKDADWFKKLETYPLFKVIGDLFFNKKVDATTAKAFWKIDQKNPPKKFDDKNLELIQQAYSFARKHDLKTVGKFIRDYTRILIDMPTDVGAIITSYMGLKEPLLGKYKTKPEEKRGTKRKLEESTSEQPIKK